MTDAGGTKLAAAYWWTFTTPLGARSNALAATCAGDEHALIAEDYAAVQRRG
jgi:hypothetical protein